MGLEIQNVVFACPGSTPESYEQGARPIAAFYADLLGMQVVREDWYLIADDGPLRPAFGDGPIDHPDGRIRRTRSRFISTSSATTRQMLAHMPLRLGGSLAGRRSPPPGVRRPGWTPVLHLLTG